MNNVIKDKVALITGASSGIGEAVAWELGRKGAKLVLAARREDRLTNLAKALKAEGIDCVVVKTDVTKRHEVEACVEKGVSQFGRIDILVNNAGIMPLSFMKNLHVEEWDRMIDVNIKGVLYGVAAVLPLLRKQKSGHIVNISSVAGRMVFPAGAVYCGTKFAVNAITEGLRKELGAREGVKFTVIEPGAVATELFTATTDSDVVDLFAGQKFDYLQPQDIARAVSYAVEQPEHVSVAEVMVIPTRQPAL